MKTDKRFVTVQNNDGEITAYAESEQHQQAINHRDTADWVWQFAPDKQTAIKQHYAKHDSWSDDQNAGRAEKVTY